MKKKENKFLLSLFFMLLIITLVFAISSAKFYNWSFWIVDIFYFALTFLILSFLKSRSENKFFIANFTQVTMIKLFVIVLFIFGFRFFLQKPEWLNFVVFNVINYIIYTVIEVKVLIDVLNE